MDHIRRDLDALRNARRVPLHGRGRVVESLTATIPREPGTSNPVAMTDLVYADGVWMTVADAPYLWVSHDNGDTWERGALPIGEEAAWGSSG